MKVKGNQHHNLLPPQTTFPTQRKIIILGGKDTPSQVAVKGSFTRHSLFLPGLALTNTGFVYSEAKFKGEEWREKIYVGSVPFFTRFYP